MLYFDQASTSYPKPREVGAAIQSYLDTIGVSPERGSYKAAQQASVIVAETRSLIAKIFAVEDPSLIAFTNNATHSLNLLLQGYLKQNDHVVICSNSHNAVIRPVNFLHTNKQVSYDILKVDQSGHISENDMTEVIQDHTSLVVINHASNVTGVITDIQPLAEFLKKKNIPLALDVSQTCGLIPINVQNTQVDFIVGTGHKTLLGPSGIGFFYAKDPFLVNPFIHGGSAGNASSSKTHPINPPFRFEAGTLNYLAIAGLHAALNYCFSLTFAAMLEKKRQLLKEFTEKMLKLDYITIYGNPTISNKVPILSFNIKGLVPSTVASLLDEKYGIAVRAGLHCAPLCHKQLGTYPSGSVRASLSHFLTQNEIDQFVNAIEKIKV